MWRSASSADFRSSISAPICAARPGRLGRVAGELRDAAGKHRLLIVVSHGVATELTDGIVEQTRRFHTLPLAEKLQLATGRGRQRVYRLSASAPIR